MEGNNLCCGLFVWCPVVHRVIVLTPGFGFGYQPIPGQLPGYLGRPKTLVALLLFITAHLNKTMACQEEIETCE
jgi:hypothetical protein